MRRLVEDMGPEYIRATIIRSGGPERTEVGEHDPKFKARPVGFTARLEPVEVEPLTWEGDGA